MVFSEGNDESSEEVGRMNWDDSVNESARAEPAGAESMFNEIKPPTYMKEFQFLPITT